MQQNVKLGLVVLLVHLHIHIYIYMCIIIDIVLKIELMYICIYAYKRLGITIISIDNVLIHVCIHTFLLLRCPSFSFFS